MADTQVLGTCVFGRAGSSPASRTQIIPPKILWLCDLDSAQNLEVASANLRGPQTWEPPGVIFEFNNSA